MNRGLVVALLTLLVCGGLGENYASAQTWQLGQYGPPSVRSHSPVSPYVTLGQSGNPGADYYGIIKPQIDANRSIGQLQYGFDNLSTGTINPATGLPLNQPVALSGIQTGHAVTYFNTGHYYPPYPNGTVSNISGAYGAGAGAGYGAGVGGYGANYSPGQGGYGNQTNQTFFSGNFNSFRR